VIQKTLALPLAALLLGFGLTWAAATPKKKAVAKAPAAKTAAKPAPKAAARYTPGKATAARRSVPAKKQTAYARGRARGRSPQPVVARRYYGQQAPTHDRYVEIQQALISRGFLNSTPTGTLDAATVDALKRFQEEQNLPPTGKITSLSLIALGLGPKRNPLSASSIPTQPVP
jgi:peptidoglycan hydrolase-like protein with peptidoglycan-binding domain